MRLRRETAPWICMFLTCVGLVSARGEGLPDATKAELATALECVNLSVDDLGWDKRPISDEWRLSVVNDALDHPLELATLAERAERELGGDFPLTAAVKWLEVDARYRLTGPNDAGSNGVPIDDGDKSLTTLVNDVARYHVELARSGQASRMHALTEEQRALVEKEAPRLYVSDEDQEPLALLTALKQVDLSEIVLAARVLARMPDLFVGESGKERVERISQLRGGRRTITAHAMKIVVGTKGDDVYKDLDVVIDPGGNDRYERVKIVVDLAGDDDYRDCGSGLLDMGAVLDMAGNDRHRGGNFTQGGAACGASILIDMAGDDSYEADQLSQGAAWYGVGYLLDKSGNDSYRGARFVQGFGGVKGIGILSDREGQDTYWAGGKYSHAPLLPENFQSLSQGFGFGLRPDVSGGIGVLLDGAGNDSYHAEVFGQGASYWFALGLLIDSAGHDKYDLYQYGQGAGIHLSPGVLMDRAGNDAYSCNNGVAQGSGHDWGVGLLWDRAGNDYYQGSGMSQGGANANAIGMIVDEGGNDAYSGTGDKNQGDSFFSRGTIGLGVLLDMAGKDRYTHGGADGATWTRGTVGVGRDVPEPKP